MFFHQNENSIKPYNYNKREGKNYFFPPHFHKDFELAYVKEGSCTVTVDGNSQEIKENEFSDETLQYSLYTKDGKEVAEGYVEGKVTSTIANNIVLKNGETAEYILIIWIAENGEDQNAEMKKSLIGQIRVDAAQKIK